MGHIDKIVALAQSYLGQQEIQPNLGFKDSSFNTKMDNVGFYKGASWCGFFVMLVLFEAYADDPTVLEYLKKYCSASTLTMWQNFRASREVITGQVPKLGSVCIWAEGSGHGGHTGLVVWVSEDGKQFKTAEGNSNSSGSANGFEVAENLHNVGLPHRAFGLNVLGFSYMPD